MAASALTFTPLQGCFLENRKQSQRRQKERKGKQLKQEVIHRSLVVENHVGGKHELVMPRSVVIHPFIVRMIVAKLWTYGDELIGPPGNSNGMLRILRREASPAANLVVKIFISHGKEGVWG